MGELIVERWRRYGKDRLYVNLPDGGGRVGWLDLQTGRTTLERHDLAAEFEAALRANAAVDLPSTRVDVPPESEPAGEGPAQSDPASTGNGLLDRSQDTPQEPFAITVDWRDLGSRQAGAAAQEQADAHRRAAPVRTWAARVLGVHTDERAWRLGAAGERRVAAGLEKLPEAWKVLHAIPIGRRGADIDHLIIGPGGVFTVNAKHHPDTNVWVGGDTLLVNGNRQPYVRNARHEAKRAARLLSVAVGSDVPVSGIIAIVGASKALVVKAQPEDVHVVAPRELVKSLTRLPEILSRETVEAVYAAARRSDTWR